MYITANGSQIATADQLGTSTPVVNTVHNDHLGSTNVVSNSSGSLIQTLDYYPYGDIRVDTQVGSSDSNKKYIGQFYDEDNSMSYLNARYYKNTRGQFLSQDSMFWSPKMNLQNPQSLNSYSYSEGNPISKSDPTGLATYIWDNGAGMTGLDTGNKNTYYQHQDTAMMNSNAALGEANRGNVAMFAKVMWPGSGSMDYRGAGNPDNRGYYFFNGQLVTAEVFGNLNYGYTGTAFGFGENILYDGAGGAQVYSSLSGRNRGPTLSNVKGNFDDPRDTANIKTGINTYNSSVNRSTISTTMAAGTNVGYNSSIRGLVKSLTALVASLTTLVNKLKQ